jgi:hypothetical protein
MGIIVSILQTDHGDMGSKLETLFIAGTMRPRGRESDGTRLEDGSASAESRVDNANRRLGGGDSEPHAEIGRGGKQRLQIILQNPYIEAAWGAVSRQSRL